MSRGSTVEAFSDQGETIDFPFPEILPSNIRGHRVITVFARHGVNQSTPTVDRRDSLLRPDL
ncbi:hypothetical protein GCM10025857_10790 [Alicyclobacillus contaminans]|nr:hypothetical protein GCM10025857_10790 [Alicyclobacillus contaminans]